jgi:predicted Fe-Mo cluster-binding NifX family protein
MLFTVKTIANTLKNERRNTMKIAIPVNENKPGTDICPSFGRAPYYMLHDTESKQTEYLANAAAQSQGGAGLRAAQFIIDSGAEAVLTVRCGQNAANVLNAAGVKIYQTAFDKADENLAAFQEGKLNLLTDIHPGFHKHS